MKVYHLATLACMCEMLNDNMFVIDGSCNEMRPRFFSCESKSCGRPWGWPDESVKRSFKIRPNTFFCQNKYILRLKK
jgi:hypothetical protein